ncbi:MAG: hypothetical protein RL346_1966 [Verrucomicrobiota bacterium]
MAKIPQFGVIERESMDFGPGGNVSQASGEFFDFIERAVYEGEFRRLFQAALGGDGLPCTTACAQNEGVNLTDLETERLLDGGDETRPVGIVSQRFLVGENHGVDRT